MTSLSPHATICQLPSLAHLNQHTQLDWCIRICIISFSECTREPLIIKVLMIAEQFCSLLFYKTEKEQNRFTIDVACSSSTRLYYLNKWKRKQNIFNNFHMQIYCPNNRIEQNKITKKRSVYMLVLSFYLCIATNNF